VCVIKVCVHWFLYAYKISSVIRFMMFRWRVECMSSKYVCIGFVVFTRYRVALSSWYSDETLGSLFLYMTLSGIEFVIFRWCIECICSKHVCIGFVLFVHDFEWHWIGGIRMSRWVRCVCITPNGGRIN